MTDMLLIEIYVVLQKWQFVFLFQEIEQVHKQDKFHIETLHEKQVSVSLFFSAPKYTFTNNSFGFHTIYLIP